MLKKILALTLLMSKDITQTLFALSPYTYMNKGYATKKKLSRRKNKKNQVCKPLSIFIQKQPILVIIKSF